MRATCGMGYAASSRSTRPSCRRTCSGSGADCGPSGISTTSCDVMAVRRLKSPRTAPEPAAREPLWYKDAIFYEVRVGAYSDSDGDGVGDFRGLTERLDYVRDL